MTTLRDSLADLSTEELTTVLLAADNLVMKAAAVVSEGVFVNLERRMFDALNKAWLSRARGAIPRALASLKGDGPATKADVTRVNMVLAAAFRGWEGPAEGVVKAVIAEGYRAGKTQVWQKAIGKINRALESESPYLSRAKADGDDAKPKKPRRVAVELKPKFGLKDEQAIKAIQNGQLYWIGEHYSENMSRRIAELSKHLMLERGLGRKAAGDAMREALEAEFGVNPSANLTRGGISIPPGWTGTSDQYFAGLAANATTTSRAHGSMRAMSDIGLAHYDIVNPEDERSCDRCVYMAENGKNMEVDHAIGRMEAISAAKSPEAVKKLHPWANSVNDLKRSKNLQEDGYGFPPYHLRCRCTVDIVEGEEPTFLEPEAPEQEEQTDLAAQLRDGKVLQKSKLGGGANGSFMVQIAGKGGEVLKGVWKPVSGEKRLRRNIDKGSYYKREAAASRIAAQLGVEDLVPTTVERKIRGSVGSVQHFAEQKHIPGSFERHTAHANNIPHLQLDRSASERMRAFDYIVGNTDRHRGNILWTQRDGKVMPIMIDHGLIFPKGTPERFIQPIDMFFTHDGPLLDSTQKMIKGIDPRALARELHAAGIEREAIRHTLRRLEALKKNPNTIAVPRPLFRVDSYQWDSEARRELQGLGAKDLQAVEQILTEETGPE